MTVRCGDGRSSRTGRPSGVTIRQTILPVLRHNVQETSKLIPTVEEVHPWQGIWRIVHDGEELDPSGGVDCLGRDRIAQPRTGSAHYVYFFMWGTHDVTSRLVMGKDERRDRALLVPCLRDGSWDLMQVSMANAYCMSSLPADGFAITEDDRPAPDAPGASAFGPPGEWP
jgi:hypothetical protein